MKELLTLAGKELQAPHGYWHNYGSWWNLGTRYESLFRTQRDIEKWQAMK